MPCNKHGIFFTVMSCILKDTKDFFTLNLSPFQLRLPID